MRCSESNGTAAANLTMGAHVLRIVQLESSKVLQQGMGVLALELVHRQLRSESNGTAATNLTMGARMTGESLCPVFLTLAELFFRQGGLQQSASSAPTRETQPRAGTGLA